MSEVIKAPQSDYTGPVVVDPLTRIEGHLRRGALVPDAHFVHLAGHDELR